MKNTRNVNQAEVRNRVGKDGTVEVLYQKMGDRWFAFSLIGDEVFLGSITEKELESTPVDQSKKRRRLGNS
jgi:hypothetical protein